MIKRCLKNYFRNKRLMKKKVRFYDCVKGFSEEDLRLLPVQVKEVAESLEDKVMSLGEGYKILRKAVKKSEGDIMVVTEHNYISYSRFAGLPMRCYWQLLKYQKVE